jgi:hypothetical protein
VLVLVLCAVATASAPAARAQDLRQHAWCGTDLASDAAREALAAYAAAREAGLLDVARKTMAPPVLGEVRSFNVLDGPDLNTASWRPRDFELVDIAAHYYQWVDVAEWNAMSAQTRDLVRALDGPMETEAPAGAFRSGHGIFENNLYLFGDLPDFDDDGGMLDLLMYDIEPGQNEGGSTVGFVHSTDINPDAPEGSGNQRLILYLDAKEGTSTLNLLAGVAAHELTHLIHFRYGGDETFNMEGLAEYGMLANGFFWRGASYLSEPEEWALPLYTWRQELRDYERANLFFGYVADRIGPEATGSIVREAQVGWNAVRDVLSRIPDAPTFGEMVKDFHTANLLNDPTVAPEFGHKLPHRSGIHAAIPPPVDGGSTSSTSATQLPVEAGAVHYAAWRSVSDFAFRFWLDSTDPADLIRFNGRMRARLVMARPDGGREWHDLLPDEQTTIDGDFAEVDLVLFNGSGAVNYLPKVEYLATWEALPTDAESDPALPAGVALHAAWPNPFNPTAVVPFALPAAGRVSIRVFDVLGRHVLTLEDGFRSAGTHSVALDASSLAGGTYLVVLDALGRRLTRTVTYLP